jgi:signal transduction histidine kinase
LKGNKNIFLFFAWGYRIFSLGLTFALTPRGSGPFRFLLWLSIGTLLFFLLRKKTVFLMMFVAIEYFAVLLYQYFEPHPVLLEFLWIPGMIISAALTTPFPWNIPIVLFMAVPGPMLLSYGSYTGTLVFIGANAYPYRLASLFIYIPVTLLSLMISGISMYTRRLRERAERLELVNLQLNKLNRDISVKIFRLKNDSTMEERKRISKEVHDTAGYVFINLIMMLQAASAVLDRDIEKAAQLIRDARDYADRGINEIRHILRNMRDYTHVSLSLQNELFDIGESFRKATTVSLTIEYGNWPRSFSKNVDSFFMSFMQECLTNALKHGHATVITIMCWRSGSEITMSVTDNGRGAVIPIKKGIGISAMEDFINQHKGSITIHSDEGGFRIRAALPLQP